MTEGLMVIAAGLLVVLCIMLSMFVFIEVILNQELGEPFRRDALKDPVRYLDKYKHLNAK